MGEQQRTAVTSVELSRYPLHRQGKVRDIFDLGDAFLMVATDRLSAFDVVLPTPIAGKGQVLTAISNLWFDLTQPLVPNHRLPTRLDELELQPDEQRQLDGRSTIVRKAERIDIECVVRGCLAGSGWKEYVASGTLADEPLPSGLSLGDALPEPRFTPAVKNDQGHDEHISREELRERVGDELATELETQSRVLYNFARELAGRAGFVLADTKFEFGWVDGTLTLIDEALTPDSSRYWEDTGREQGVESASFDKQIVRDWLEEQAWDKAPPGPELPGAIVQQTYQRYADVLERLRTVAQQEPT